MSLLVSLAIPKFVGAGRRRPELQSWDVSQSLVIATPRLAFRRVHAREAMVMKDLIDIRGASGAVYRFALHRDGRPLSPMGGNYLYVRAKEDRPHGFEVVHVGEGQNLLTDAHGQWDKAVK
ncbi:MAG: hypothetical protein ACREEX_10370, partial [Caulobacteraceae bacterium]